ncbi:GDP-mannose 4,6-dehydratase [Candidatus Woesearchaeota archaeon]|nr:GDP-mannose 4,6-dehydratase [Candidatus Woesearchaeota archaeon]
MYKNVLVTGGAGFIGSHACWSLLKRGVNVVSIDNFDEYYDPKIKEENTKALLKNKNFRLYKSDVADLKSLLPIFKENSIQAILHLAARAGVRPSIEDPFSYVKTNVEGTLNLLEMARRYKIKKFVFTSSSSVYGLGKVPFSENMSATNPVSPYAATKLSAELMCRTYYNLYKIPIVCLRLFTVYGPRGRPDMAPFKFMKLILEGKDLPVYGDGTSKRDYTYVSDVIDGILSSMEKNLGFEIINIGNSNPVDLKAFIRILEKHTGKKAKVKRLGVQKGDVPITYADISKARRILGYNPKISLDAGIRKMVEWYTARK